jgi:prophage antirepressor-like protein
MMRDSLQIFDFEGKSGRFVMAGGEPWFVARDAAEALGYPESSLVQVTNLFGHISEGKSAFAVKDRPNLDNTSLKTVQKISEWVPVRTSNNCSPSFVCS